MLSETARGRRSIEAVVIGGSAGAIEALARLLPYLPAECAAPVVIVVHLPPGPAGVLPGLFERSCALPTREPLDKEPVRGGVVWFAPADYHLLFDRREAGVSFALSIDPPVRHSRPSIDVLFESASEAFAGGLVCVVLTGANEDGAHGARAIGQRGGEILVQDPSTAFSPQMPAATLAATQAELVADIDGIGRYLRTRLGK